MFTAVGQQNAHHVEHQETSAQAHHSDIGHQSGSVARAAHSATSPEKDSLDIPFCGISGWDQASLNTPRGQRTGSGASSGTSCCFQQGSRNHDFLYGVGGCGRQSAGHKAQSNRGHDTPCQVATLRSMSSLFGTLDTSRARSRFPRPPSGRALP